MSLEVPPTSTKTPLAMRSYISAAATPAAGPESIVSTGRFRMASMSMIPPSERMTISGASMPLAATARAVRSAVSIMIGSMLALIAAVSVRMRRP